MSRAGGHRVPWQVPEGGLTADERQAFFERVKMRRVAENDPVEHWIWTGVMVGKPAFMLRGSYVSAARIAWGMKHSTLAIPGRLMSRCGVDRCIRPDCHEGANGAPAVSPPREEINRVATGSDLRTVEALAAIQFGLPIKPRTLPALKRRAELDECSAEIIETYPREEVIVEKPATMQSFVPNAAEAALAPRLTAEQILKMVFEPDTIVMTFRTGHIWVMKPNVKVDGDSPQEVMHGVLQLTGRHAVKG